MKEIKLDLEKDEIIGVAKLIGKELTPESESYIKEMDATMKEEEIFEKLGRAVFNEKIIESIKYMMERENK